MQRIRRLSLLVTSTFFAIRFFVLLYSCTSAAVVPYATQTCTFCCFHFRLMHFAEFYLDLESVQILSLFPSLTPSFLPPSVIGILSRKHTLLLYIKLQFDPDLPSICLVMKVYEVDVCLHICSPS